MDKRVKRRQSGKFQDFLRHVNRNNAERKLRLEWDSNSLYSYIVLFYVFKSSTFEF